MSILHLLGTGASLSDPHRTTTMLAFENDTSVVVVDCGGDVVQRLMEAGVPLERIEAMIVTHTHADHISGFPLFMQKLWLAGRREPLPVYGIAPAITLARRLFAQFDTAGWEGFPEIQWREIALKEDAPVLDSESWTITASPGKHSVPVVGLRVIDRQGGGVVAYSSDTERVPEITRMARGAQILVHEATGDFAGHTTAADAARVAAEAGAGRLLLVHLPPEEMLGAEEMATARRIFPATEKGEEIGRYEFQVGDDRCRH